MRTMQAVFRKRDTFAPTSPYEAMEDIVRAGRGSEVEVLMSWGERVLQVTTLDKKEFYAVGYDPKNDIVLPSLPGVPSSVVALGWQKNQLSVNCQTGCAIHIIDENKATSIPSPVSGSWAPLNQGSFVKVEFGNGFSLSVRYKGQLTEPKVLPVFDFSSKGFWSVFLSTVFSGWLSLWFSQRASGVTPKSVPPRVAKLLITAPISKPVRVTVPSQKTKVVAKIQKKVSPKIKKSNVDGNVKSSVSRNQKPKGNELTGGSRAAKPNAKNYNQKKGRQGTAVKGSELVARSSLFANMGGAKNLDQNGGLGNRSSLSDLADGATGKSGKGTGQGWAGSGSQFKNIEGRGSHRGNVGVGKLSGPGRGAFRAGRQGLGGKSLVSIQSVAPAFSAAGTIDKEAIRKVFFANSKAIRYCYESQLNRNSKLQGKIVLDFEIGEQGRVVGRPRIDQANSTTASAGLSRCLLTRLKIWTFPEPPKNQVVRVLYPLAFSQ